VVGVAVAVGVGVVVVVGVGVGVNAERCHAIHVSGRVADVRRVRPS
jgi:hypothetical protein